MKRSLLSLVVGLAACQAPVGVRNVEVPRDSAPQCASLCSGIGLPLDSVVIMANNVGCVCRAAPPPPSATPSTAAPGSASAGGMAAVMMAEEEQQEAERSRRSAQSAQPHHY
jgi:hypothetical protein